MKSRGHSAKGREIVLGQNLLHGQVLLAELVEASAANLGNELFLGQCNYLPLDNLLGNLPLDNLLGNLPLDNLLAVDAAVVAGHKLLALRARAALLGHDEVGAFITVAASGTE